GGRLYLITNTGWQRISISGRVISMPPTFLRGAVAITADPRRHRLLREPSLGPADGVRPALFRSGQAIG
ncbi:MAG TPA: hypothetical protein VE441_14630, partial [Mycobacterium sp.]|nr:hypothetical protein [Mycobacterium sp.]